MVREYAHFIDHTFKKGQRILRKGLLSFPFIYSKMIFSLMFKVKWCPNYAHFISTTFKKGFSNPPTLEVSLGSFPPN